MDQDDLISVGVLGLIHAAKTYDPNLGASFKTYAYTNIKGAILDELRRHDTVPRSARDRIKKVEEATARLMDRTGRIPTPEEIAKEAGITVKALDDILHSVRTSALLSLNETYAASGESASLIETLPGGKSLDPSELAEKSEMIELMMKAIRKLPEAERQVVFLYYNQNMLLKEIGAVLEVSESRICQILSRAHYLLNKEIRHMGG
jgi:RNA polymerase sigma factor for flagellar operon FliA